MDVIVGVESTRLIVLTFFWSPEFRPFCGECIAGFVIVNVHVPGSRAVGWLWVAFRVPYKNKFENACREGWIHPGILNVEDAER